MNYDGSDKPDWAYSDYVLVSRLDSSERGRLFFLENLEHNYSILNRFSNDDILIVSIGAYFALWNFNMAKLCINFVNPNFNLKNVYWLANTLEQVDHAVSEGFNAIYCNQNAFINEDVFNIQDTEKKYDLVMNIRPEIVKRPWLAMKNTNIAIIQGINYSKVNFWDLNQLHPVYMNQQRISKDEVVMVLNSSYVGGMFSEKEGACFASSEYLLCGLPVVSTASQGGRDIWYNDYNSMIVEPHEDAVLEGTKLLVSRVKEKKILPQEIRQQHLELSYQHRARLIELLGLMADRLNLKDDPVDIMNIIRTKWAPKVSLSDVDAVLFS